MVSNMLICRPRKILVSLHLLHYTHTHTHTHTHRDTHAQGYTQALARRYTNTNTHPFRMGPSSTGGQIPTLKESDKKLNMKRRSFDAAVSPSFSLSLSLSLSLCVCLSLCLCVSISLSLYPLRV